MKSIIYGVVFLAGMSFFWRQFIPHTSNDGTYDLANLQKIADGSNKTLPTMLDTETRLERVTVKAHLLEQHHTLVNLLKSNIDVEDFKENSLQLYTEQVCHNRQSINLARHNVTLWFSYKDKSGADILTVKIPPETQCPNKKALKAM